MINSSKTALKIGDMVKFYRMRANLSKKELAKSASIPLDILLQIESNTVIPDLKTIHKIANSLKLGSKDLSLMLGVNLYKFNF